MRQLSKTRESNAQVLTGEMRQIRVSAFYVLYMKNFIGTVHLSELKPNRVMKASADPAVNSYGCAGHKTGFFACQEEGNLCNFFWLPNPPERMVISEDL